MQLLLRKMFPDARGAIEFSDRELEADQILIGSSPDCDIQILGEGIALRHARLLRAGNDNQLQAHQAVMVNGKPSKKVNLQPGDELLLGIQLFRCIEPPDGFDLALEWHAEAVEGHWLAGAYRTSLDELGFSLRRTSWLLALLILLGAGLLPVGYYFGWDGFGLDGFGLGRIGLNGDTPESQQRPVSQRATPETFWRSGPLLPAHQIAIGNDCSVCHPAAFVPVQDKACASCHTDMAEHVPLEHPKVSRFAGFTCQSCHQEHNEPASIVAASDGLCTDCHSAQAPAVSGFSETSHPEFVPSLLKPDVAFTQGVFAVTWTRQKQTLDAQRQEQNQLKFAHDIHLNPEKVSHGQRGGALYCTDCHQLSADREHFSPITMQSHCNSCHELSFDRNYPQKQLPHGTPSAVYEALEAHFVAVAFGTLKWDGIERRRLPAREWQDDKCDKDFACAQRQAFREAGQQFLHSGCITCHEVREVPKAERAERWQVLPVRLNQNWFADARFDHQSHFTQSGLRGDAVCLSCHAADRSAASTDILMPALQQCTSCHGDSSVAERVPLHCIACHAYHRDSTQDTPAAALTSSKGAPDATP